MKDDATRRHGDGLAMEWGTTMAEKRREEREKRHRRDERDEIQEKSGGTLGGVLLGRMRRGEERKNRLDPRQL
jgi:hypothetical protein